MNFDKVMIKAADGQEKSVTAADFLKIPLGERIELMTTSRVKFFRDGQQIPALDAVRRTK
jgi:hypothetical protein